MGLNKRQGNTMLKDRMQSPSRIPRFSPAASLESVTWQEAVSSGPMIPDASTSPRCCAVPNSKDVIAQLLDDMISNVASVASKQKKQQLTSIGAGIDPTASHILTARAAEPPKSAITALKEGIDATCDEISSIAAMEALNGGPHASLLPTQPPKQPGAAPQGMLELFCTTEFAAESLEVDGPADSWLRASREMPPASSEVQTVSCSPGGLVLTRQEPSWNDCVTSRESKLHSVEVCTAAAAPASAPAAAAQPAAVSVFGEQECELTRHQNSQPASASPAAAASDGAAAVTCLTDGSDSSSKTAAPAVRSRQQKVGANLRTPGQQSSLPASQHQQQCPQLPPLQTATSSTCVDGLDVLLNSNCRRAHSSSINISSSAGASTSSSLSCDQPKDDGSAAWMTSLRSRSSPIGSCKRTMSRSQSSGSAGGQTHSSRTRMLHSNHSARTGTTPAGAMAAFSTPPSGVKSSGLTGTTPRSAQSTGGGSSNSSLHQRMSLRRTRRESAQSASASPCEPASRTSSAQLTGGAPASLTLTPQGSGASKALPAAASRTQSTRSVRLSQDSTQVVANRTAAAVGGLIGPASGVACGDHGVPCTDEISELLLSEQDIMADPTAIQLFMELNEEIEAEGRAALEAAEAAAAATAVRPAAQARPDPVEAVVLSNAAVASYDTLACSTEAVMQLQPASRSDETQPVAVSDRGQAGQAYLQQQEQVQQMDGAAVKVSGHDQVRGSGCCQVQDNAAEMPTAAADPTSTTVEACAKSNAATEEAAVPVRACSTEATEHQSKKHEEQPEHQPSCGCQCVIM